MLAISHDTKMFHYKQVYALWYPNGVVCIHSNSGSKMNTVNNIIGDIDSKKEEKKWKSCAPLFEKSSVSHDSTRGLCSDLRILQHPPRPLAKTHWAYIETKLVCEVYCSQYRYISKRKQVEVFELKHRLTSSWDVLLPRLTHKKHTYDIWSEHRTPPKGLNRCPGLYMYFIFGILMSF